MKKQIILLVALVMLLGMFVNAAPGEKACKKEAKCDKVSACLDQIPDMTAEQKTKIKALAGDFHKKVAPLKEELKKLEVELKKLMTEGAGEAKVGALIDKGAKVKAKLHKMSYAHGQAFKKLLTPEQQKKCKVMMCASGGHGKACCKKGAHAAHAHKCCKKAAHAHKCKKGEAKKCCKKDAKKCCKKAAHKCTKECKAKCEKAAKCCKKAAHKCTKECKAKCEKAKKECKAKAEKAAKAKK